MEMQYNTDELQHHGILGQKWGVRRFQRKDGSLTSAGKKRLHNGESSESSKPSDTNKTNIKRINEMTDQELSAFRNRLQTQKDITRLYSELYPERISRGKKFVDSMKDSVTKSLTNAVSEATKAFVSNTLKNKLGLDDPDDELSKEVNRLRNQVAKKDLLRQLSGNNDPDDELSKEVNRLRNQVAKKDLEQELSGENDKRKEQERHAADVKRQAQTIANERLVANEKKRLLKKKYSKRSSPHSTGYLYNNKKTGSYNGGSM